MPKPAQDLESSPGSDPQGVNEDSPSSDVPESLEDAIRDVLDPTEASDGEEGDSDDDGEQDPTGETETDSSTDGVDGEPPEGGELSPDDGAAVAIKDDESFLAMLKDNDVPLGKVERFKELLDERKALLSQNEQLSNVQSQLGEIQVAGESAGMTPEQLTDLFSLPVLLANDPAKALEAIGRLQGFIAESAGEVLPEDLQGKVDSGHLDEESAREVAKARANEARSNREAEATRSRGAQEREQQRIGSLQSAVNTYEASLHETDPDYAKKQRFVKLELQELVRSKPPSTPEEAKALAEEAYKNVNEVFKDARPTPKPKKQLNRSNAHRPAAEQPSTMLEAISAAVGGATED